MAAMFKRNSIHRGWHSPIVTMPTWNAAYRLASSNKLMFPFTCKRPHAEIKPIVTRQELLNTFELMPTVSTGTWATSPERTAKRALNTRRVNGYIIISISCSNTLRSRERYKEIDFRLRDLNAILFAFRCEDCRRAVK